MNIASDTFRRVRVAIAIVCVFFPGMVSSRLIHADESKQGESNPYVWKPKTKSVSVFKNGFGFFTREGEVELQEGWGHASDVPPAAFGTLAIYSAQPEQLVDIVGVGNGELIEFDRIPSAERESRRKEVLEASLSMNVKLVHRAGAPQQETVGILKALSGGYAVVEQATGAAAIPVQDITSLQRMDLPLRFHAVEEGGAAARRVALHMAYLRSGIVWIPEYTLKIVDETTAELTLRGTLVNEAEDLIDCDVHFVVGVPHFVHSDMLSPVAVGQVLRSIGSAIPSSGVPLQNMAQVMNRAVISNDFQNGRGQSLPSSSIPPNPFASC